MEFKQKYLKYKNKYLNLKTYTGGSSGINNPAFSKLYNLKDRIIESLYNLEITDINNKIEESINIIFSNEPIFIPNKSIPYNLYLYYNSDSIFSWSYNQILDDYTSDDLYIGNRHNPILLIEKPSVIVQTKQMMDVGNANYFNLTNALEIIKIFLLIEDDKYYNHKINSRGITNIKNMLTQNINSRFDNNKIKLVNITFVKRQNLQSYTSTELYRINNKDGAKDKILQEEKQTEGSNNVNTNIALSLYSLDKLITSKIINESINIIFSDEQIFIPNRGVLLYYNLYLYYNTLDIFSWSYNIILETDYYTSKTLYFRSDSQDRRSPILLIKKPGVIVESDENIFIATQNYNKLNNALEIIKIYLLIAHEKYHNPNINNYYDIDIINILKQNIHIKVDNSRINFVNEIYPKRNIIYDR